MIKVFVILLLMFVTIILLFYLKKINIKYSNSKNVPFIIKSIVIILFLLTIGIPIFILYEILSFFNKAEGTFAAFTYLIFSIVYLILIINFTSVQKDKVN